jgi:hypothetical protein
VHPPGKILGTPLLVSNSIYLH